MNLNVILQKALGLLLCFFVIFWISFLWIDYYNKHGEYIESFIYFRYTNWGIGQLILLSLFSFGLQKLMASNAKRGLFIIAILAAFVINVWYLAYAFSSFYPNPISIYDYGQLIGNALYVLFSGLSIIYAAYVLGNAVNTRILYGELISVKHYTIDIAIGISCWIVIIFIISALHIFNFWTTLLLLIGSVLVNRNEALKSIKNIFNYSPKFSIIEYGLLYIIGIFSIINFVFILGPFPLGFDSRNLYINLTKLIGQNNGLVKGFQPHNWELFMSTGLILFKKLEVTMFLSQIGGILSAWATYFLGRTYFKISVVNCLLVCLVLIVTPAISRQMYIELKVDLALLYFQLVTLIIFLSHAKKANLSKISMLKFSVFIGFLFGISIGIKLLHIFLIFGIYTVWAYSKKNAAGMYGVALLGISIMLFLDLDGSLDLRKFHIYADELSYILFITGVALIGYYLKSDYELGKMRLLQFILVGVVTSMTFSPWIIKRYVETKSLELTSLIRGGGSGHGIDFEKIKLISERQSNGETNE